MNIRLVRVPYHLGHAHSGSGRGPRRLMQTGLRDALASRGHATSVAGVRRQAGVQHEVGAVFELSRLLAAHVADAVRHGEFPLVLSGDCTASLGAIAGLDRAPVGIVWFDAHGDFNTPETTVSGYLGGMPLAAAVGRCWAALCASLPGFRAVPESQVVLVGTRALDPLEADLLERSAVQVVSESQIRKAGLAQALGAALDALRARVDSIYLHLDMDVLDPAAGRANVYQEPGGLTGGELEEAVRMACARLSVSAATLAAYDPAYDSDGRVARAGVRAILALADGIAR